MSISSNRRNLFAAIAIPLFSLLFMATVFGSGKIENLPLGVVTESYTPLVQQIIMRVGASPVLDIKPQHIFADPASAKQAMQDMEIFGYITIPEDFSEDLLGGDTPTISCHYHYALLAVGGEIQGAVVKALGSSSASIVSEYGNRAGLTEPQKNTIVLPTNGVFTSSYNSTLNYSIFLSYPFFFIFFQIFILVFTVYIIGTDMNREWLQSASGSIINALAGKLAPYAAIFAAQTLLANAVFFIVADIPIPGSMLAANISSLLLVAASLSLGIAIISIIPKLPIAISIASMVGALGATASGVTFPIENMYPFFRVLCSLFPIRHFILANQDILYNNAGIAYSWSNYAILLLIAAVCISAAPLLKRSIMRGNTGTLPAMWGVALVMLGGTVGYGFLYGLMYHPNIVTDVPVAVIDKSQSHLSRQYIRNIDATQGIDIVAECTDMAQGEQLMKSSKAKGLIYIPADFQKRAAQGLEASFKVYETTTSFLYYLTIQKAVASTMQEMNNSLRRDAIKSLGIVQQLEMASTPTFTTNTIAVYNSNGGYGTYLLPIALIVIYFQTLLMSGGILAGSRIMPPHKFLPLLAAGYFLISFFLMGAIPHIFSLPTLAAPADMYIFLLLFTAASTAFTGCFTLLLKTPEEVMLYVPFFSVGLIFLSGASFPFVQIPHLWQIVHYLFPTSPGITGYIQLNSMGCSLHNITPSVVVLTVQLLIYGTIFLLYYRKIVHLHNNDQ